MGYYMGDYYRGDYYRGDYYRGDPFALPLIGALGKVAAKVLPGIAKKAVGAVGKLIGGGGAKGAIGSSIGTSITPYIAPAVIGGAASVVASNIRSVVSGGAPPPISGVTYGTMVPRGGLKGTLQRLLPGGETGYYKRRRMNVTNAKALRRAIRRATGFAKLAKRVLTFTQAKAPKGRAKFKVGRKRA